MDVNYKHHQIIKNFINLKNEFLLEDKLIDSFFTSMELDLTKKSYATYEELKHYIYGSAEVIGLMISKILGLPESSYPYAQKLGESMQFINFIRDYKEDKELGRTYLPKEFINNFGQIDFEKPNEKFDELIRFCIDKYKATLKEASLGFSYIPLRFLIPIKTASDMYLDSANKIYENPKLILVKKYKPSKFNVLFAGLKNLALLPLSRNQIVSYAHNIFITK